MKVRLPPIEVWSTRLMSWTKRESPEIMAKTRRQRSLRAALYRPSDATYDLLVCFWTLPLSWVEVRE